MSFLIRGESAGMCFHSPDRQVTRVGAFLLLLDLLSIGISACPVLLLLSAVRDQDSGREAGQSLA